MIIEATKSMKITKNAEILSVLIKKKFSLLKLPNYLKQCPSPQRIQDVLYPKSRILIIQRDRRSCAALLCEIHQKRKATALGGLMLQFPEASLPE